MHTYIYNDKKLAAGDRGGGDKKINQKRSEKMKARRDIWQKDRIHDDESL